MFLEFEGIHNGGYIGINHVKFYDKDENEIPYVNIQVDGQDVDHNEVQPAFPPNGWWAIWGDQHSVLFDFQEVKHVAEVHVWCANMSATPKIMYISDSKQRAPSEEECQFEAGCYIQLAGDEACSPDDIDFRKSPKDKKDVVSCSEIVKMLNKSPPKDGFQSFLSGDGKYCYAFYRQGLKSQAYDYYFGLDSSRAVEFVNSIQKVSGDTISDVAMRAMTLDELQAVRAIIMSSCIKDGWKSSRNGSALRPDDLNLYDLNSILIKPLTKKRNCAFKELFPSGKTTPSYYSSHWWGEKVLDFIRCCEEHARMNGLAPHEATYWVCAYANRQHDLGTDLGTDPDKSSFRRAMNLAKGVLLILDPEAVVFSRIWVDFELFKTVDSSFRNLDIITRYSGTVHLLSKDPLPDESTYQKIMREMKFPFKTLTKKGITVELYNGEASREIDKVRIMNSMAKNPDLDDKNVLLRSEKADSNDPKYVEDMSFFSAGDAALRSMIALKCWPMALQSDGFVRGFNLEQAPSNDGRRYSGNYHGFHLTDIVKTDKRRTQLIMNDFVSCDGMTDDEFESVIDVLSPSITHFEFDVRGCKHLTNECLSMIGNRFKNLTTLRLNVGYSTLITDEGVIALAKSLPSKAKILELNVTPNKQPSGSYEPVRTNEHLLALAENLSAELVDFKLTTTLGEDESEEGIVELTKSLPKDIKHFTLCLESRPGFAGSHFVEIAKHLPKSLESLDLHSWGGEYFEESDIKLFRAEIMKLKKLKKLRVDTSDDGKRGYYAQRKFSSIDELKKF
jgi:hypothetical protein